MQPTPRPSSLWRPPSPCCLWYASLRVLFPFSVRTLPTLFVFLAQSIGAQGPGNYSVNCQTTAPQPITETIQALVLLGDSVMAGGNVTIHYRTRQLYILCPPFVFHISHSNSLYPTPSLYSCSAGTWRMEWVGGPLDGAVQVAYFTPTPLCFKLYLPSLPLIYIFCRY